MSFDVDEDGFAKPLTVSVVRPTIPMAFPADEYHLPCGFKGHALIVNIIEFDQPQLNRKGAMHDTTYMSQLWGGLGFRTDSIREGRITAHDLKNTLNDFKKKLETEMDEISCIAVFIGSHGRDPDKILTSDMSTVDLYNDIVYQFDVSHCPGLNVKLPGTKEARKLSKPKLFFVQACRTEREGAGNKSASTKISTDEVLAPSLTDAIVCYSTMPKTVSYKNGYGSFFAYCLTSVFMKNAYRSSLHDLLQETAEEVVRYDGKFQLTHRHAQVPTYKPYLLDATKLYFNMETLSFPRVQLKETLLPHRLPYYVRRTLRTRNVLSDEIFEQEKADIFLFSGMSLAKVSALAKNVSAANSGEQLMQNEIVARFLVLNHPSHFEKVCKKVEGPVHWISAGRDKKLRWVKSRGEVAFLQQCVAGKHLQDLVREEDFCTNLEANSNAPICIVDSPGMGKSMMLAEIGRRLKVLYPTRAVIFLTLSELIEEITRIKDIHGNLVTAIQKALGNLACEDPLTGAFQDMLESADETVGVELLLDGLDEMQPDRQALAYEILQTIRVSFKSIRMWVTSRPHVLHQLETALNTLGHHICPFSHDDQLHSITSYWTRIRNELEPIRLNQFAVQCLQNLSEKMSSGDEHIAGIPLQCLMIAEVFEEPAHIYAESGETLSIPAELQLNSIADMYRLLIQRKLDKYKKISGDSAVEDIVVLKMHMKLAFELLLPERNPLATVPVRAAELLKVGLIEATDNASSSSARFIHRTFAEYLVTRYIANRMLMGGEDWTEELNETLFDQLLAYEPITFTTKVLSKVYRVWSYKFTSVFPNFLSCMLGDSVTVPEITLRACHHSLTGVLKQLYYASMHANCVNLAKFFVKASSTERLLGLEKLREKCTAKWEQYLDFSMLYLSAQVPSLSLFQFTLGEFQRFVDISLDTQWKIVQLAVRRGRLDVLQFLLNELGLRQYFREFNSLPDDAKELLLICTVDSDSESAQLVGSWLEIIRLLVEANPNFLEHRERYENRSPLVCKYVHPQLLCELIQLGANILAKDAEKNTVLHMPLERHLWTAADYHSLLTAISLEDLRKIMSVENNNKETPLQSVLRWMDPLTKTLSRFHEAGANFNYCAEREYSVLATAVMKRRSVAVIRKLIECGADVRWKYYFMETTLFHIALKWGNLAVATLLVHEHGFNSKERTKDNRTILHLYCDHFYSEIMDVSSLATIMPLEELKELVHAEDDDGKTPLHHLVGSQMSRLVVPEELTWFQKAGSNFNHRNSYGGNSILASAVISKKSAAVLRKLIDCGADVKWRTWNRKNLLHCAAETANWEAVEFLVKEMGFDVNERSWTFSTPLRYAEKPRWYCIDTDKNKTIQVLTDLGATR